MKRLYILRHAKSSWAQPGLSDIDRPLNDRGQAQVQQLSAWWLDAQPPLDSVLVSPSRRTKETLAGLNQAFGQIAIQTADELYNGSADNYLSLLWSQTSGAVMLIGHNPTCDELSRWLTKPSSPEAGKLTASHFATATLAVFDLDIDDWASLGRGCGLLTQFLRPRDLKKTA